MYRYLERAENTARLLAAGHRMALTRGADAATEEWRSVLTTLGLLKSYEVQHDDYSTAHVCDFVLRGKGNPESVLAMVEKARLNARVCRSAITLEVWEAVDEGWMTLRELLARPVRVGSLGPALAAIRRESTLARGATHGSMLRNEIYFFTRAGTFLERADNTARILDVKYYLLLPSVAYVGTALDTAQWDNVLRSLSGERAYRWLNAGRMDARSIAEFGSLAALARVHVHVGLAHELIRWAAQELTGKTMDEIFDHGRHQFLLAFIVRNREVASAIAEQYRFPA